MAAKTDTVTWDNLVVPLCSKLFVYWTSKGKHAWLKHFLKCKQQILKHDDRYDAFYVAFCLLSTDFLTDFERKDFIREDFIKDYDEAYEVLIKYFLKRLPKDALTVCVPPAVLDPYQVWHKSTVTLPESSAGKPSRPPFQRVESDESGFVPDSRDSSPPGTDKSCTRPGEGEPKKLDAHSQVARQDSGLSGIESHVRHKRGTSKYEKSHNWMDLHVRVMCLRYEMKTTLSKHVVSPYPIKSFRHYDDGEDKEVNVPTSYLLRALRALCSGGASMFFAADSLKICLRYVLRCVDVPDFVTLSRPKCGDPILPDYEYEVIEYQQDRRSNRETKPWLKAEDEDKWRNVDCIINKDHTVNFDSFEREVNPDYSKLVSVADALDGKEGRKLVAEGVEESLSNLLAVDAFAEFVSCYNALAAGKTFAIPNPDEAKLPNLLDCMDSALGFMNLVAFHESEEINSNRKRILLKYAIIGVEVALHVLSLGRSEDVQMLKDEPLFEEPQLSEHQLLLKSLVNKGLQFYSIARRVFKRTSEPLYDLQYFTVLLLAPSLNAYMQQLLSESRSYGSEQQKPEEFPVIKSNFVSDCGRLEGLLCGTNFLLWPLGLLCCAILDDMMEIIRTRHSQTPYKADHVLFSNKDFCDEKERDAVTCIPQMMAHVMESCPLYNLLFLLSSAAYCKGAHLTKPVKSPEVFKQDYEALVRKEKDVMSLRAQEIMDSVEYKGDPENFNFCLYMIKHATDREHALRGEPYPCGHVDQKCVVDPECTGQSLSDVDSTKGAERPPWEVYMKKKPENSADAESVASSLFSVEYKLNAVYDPSAPVPEKIGYAESLDLDKISHYSGEGDDSFVMDWDVDNELFIYVKEVARPNKFLSLCARALSVLGKVLCVFSPSKLDLSPPLEAGALAGIARSLDDIAPGSIEKSDVLCYDEVSKAMESAIKGVWGGNILPNKLRDLVLKEQSLCLGKYETPWPINLTPRVMNLLFYHVGGFFERGKTIWLNVVDALASVATCSYDMRVEDVLPVEYARMLCLCYVTKIGPVQAKELFDRIVAGLVAASKEGKNRHSAAAVLATGRLVLLLLVVLRHFGETSYPEDFLTLVEAFRTPEERALSYVKVDEKVQNVWAEEKNRQRTEYATRMPKLARVLQNVYKNIVHRAQLCSNRDDCTSSETKMSSNKGEKAASPDMDVPTEDASHSEMTRTVEDQRSEEEVSDVDEEIFRVPLENEGPASRLFRSENSEPSRKCPPKIFYHVFRDFDDKLGAVHEDLKSMVKEIGESPERESLMSALKRLRAAYPQPEIYAVREKEGTLEQYLLEADYKEALLEACTKEKEQNGDPMLVLAKVYSYSLVCALSNIWTQMLAIDGVSIPVPGKKLPKSKTPGRRKRR